MGMGGSQALRRAVAGCVLAGWLLSGCAAGGDARLDTAPVDTPVDKGAARVSLGAGEGGFRRLADGDALELIRGPQGSQHIWLGLRAYGLAPAGVIVTLEARRVRDQAKVSQAFVIRMSLAGPPGETAGDPYTEATGLALVIPRPDDVWGEDLAVRAMVEDREGRKAEAEAGVVIREWG